MPTASTPTTPEVPPGNRLRGGALTFFVLTLAGIVVVFMSGARGSAPPRLPHLQVGFLLLALASATADVILGGLRFHVFIRRSQPRRSLWLSIRADLAGRFLGAVTPSQTGGGPAQVFVLHRGGVPIPEVLSLLLINLISTLVFLLMAGSLSAWLLRDHLGSGAVLRLTQSAPFLALAALGVTVIALVRPQIVAGALRPLARRSGREPGQRPSVIARVAGLLVDSLEQYRAACRRFVWENPWLPAASLALTAVMFLNKFGLAWLLIRGLGVESDFATTVALVALVYIGLLLVPSPGGSGIAELATGALLTIVLPASLTGPFTLVYRLLTVYLPAAAGAWVLLGVFDPRRARALALAPRVAVPVLVLALSAAAPASADTRCPLCRIAAPATTPLTRVELEAAAESLAARNRREIDRVDALLRAGHLGPPSSREARARAQLIARMTLTNWYSFLLPFADDPERVRTVAPEAIAGVASRYCEALAVPVPRLLELRLGHGYVCARYDLGGAPEEGWTDFGGRRLRYRVGERMVGSRPRRVLGLDWPSAGMGKVEVLVEEHYGFRLVETRMSDDDDNPCDLYLALDVSGGWVRHHGVHRPAAFAFWATRPGHWAPYLPRAPWVGAAIYLPGLRLDLPLLPDINLGDLRALALPMPFLEADDLRRGTLPSWLPSKGQAKLSHWTGEGRLPTALRGYFPDLREAHRPEPAGATAAR